MSSPLTALEITARITAGTLRPQEIVASALAQIERYEPQLSAWVRLQPEVALETATLLEQEAKRGRPQGVLHGVPVGVKDIIDVAGLPTRSGSELTSPDPVAEDAPLVRKLRDAGAIILGKTVTTEFACFDPAETRNPWNLERTPGGSSSGSAAAVAAGMVPLAIGSQTGGSVTRPASYCGIASCKPTFGRIDRTGVFPVSDHLDHVGIFARTVADLALLLNVVQEEFCDAIPIGIPPNRTPPTIAVPQEFFLTEADEETRRSVLESISRLEAAGAEIVPAELPPSFAEVHAMHWRIMAREAAEVHRQWFAQSPESYGPRMTGLLNEGLALAQADYEAALAHQQRFTQEITASIPPGAILLTPATPAPAPDRTSTGDPRFNSPWSYSGLPTVSLPCGLSSDGLPICLQLMGAAWSDAELFPKAAWVERVIGWNALPPLLRSA